MTLREVIEILESDEFKKELMVQTGTASWQEAVAQTVSLILGPIFVYRFYRKRGAPKWAARAIATLTAWHVRHGYDLKSLRKQLIELQQ